MPGGLPLILELQIASTSPTTTRWYYRNFEIRPSKGILIENIGDFSSRLTYENPLEGIYKAAITNEFGIANFETRVLVEFPAGCKSVDGKIKMLKL